MATHIHKCDGGTDLAQELRDAGAIRDADPMERAAHVQRLQGMAAEMKAMIGALNGANAAKRDNSNYDDEEEEEEQLYVNIGAIMNKGRDFGNSESFYRSCQLK